MKTIVTLLLVATYLTSLGQELDKIVRKDGNTINCIVTEIGSNEIKYHYPDRPKLTFGVDHALVDRVEFSSGEVIKIEASTFNNMAYYAGQKQRAIKTGFLKPLNTNLEFTYEQSIKPGRAWEATIGVIGIGFDITDINPAGIFAKYTYKLSRTPDYYMHRMHYSHILKGAYFAPEVATRYVKFDSRTYNWQTYEDEINRKEEFSIAFILKFGKQWVFEDIFLIDVFGGFGYGFTTMNSDYEWINYGFRVFPSDLPLAFTSGIRIGLVF